MAPKATKEKPVLAPIAERFAQAGETLQTLAKAACKQNKIKYACSGGNERRVSVHIGRSEVTIALSRFGAPKLTASTDPHRYRRNGPRTKTFPQTTTGFPNLEKAVAYAVEVHISGEEGDRAEERRQQALDANKFAVARAMKDAGVNEGRGRGGSIYSSGESYVDISLRLKTEKLPEALQALLDAGLLERTDG